MRLRTRTVRGRRRRVTPTIGGPARERRERPGEPATRARAWPRGAHPQRRRAGRPVETGEPAAEPRPRSRGDDLETVSGVRYAELAGSTTCAPTRASRAGLRRGGPGRARPLHPRVRPAAADRRAPVPDADGRRSALRARHGRAPLAGRREAGLDAHPGDRARDGRRRPAARRPAGEHPPGQLNPLEEAAAYQQLLDDFGCTHEELATPDRPQSRPQSATRSACCGCRRGAAPGRRRRAVRRPRPGAARPRRRRRAWRRSPTASSPRGSRCGRSRRSSPSVRPTAASATRVARPRDAERARAERARRPALGPARDPGAGRARARPRARSPSSSPRSRTSAGSSTSSTATDTDAGAD